MQNFPNDLEPQGREIVAQPVSDVDDPMHLRMVHLSSVRLLLRLYNSLSEISKEDLKQKWNDPMSRLMKSFNSLNYSVEIRESKDGWHLEKREER